MSSAAAPINKSHSYRLVRSLPAGVLAGFASLAFDELSAILTLGDRVLVPLPLLGVYLGVGIAMALLIEAASLALRRRGVGFFQVAAGAAAAMYAPAVWSRFLVGPKPYLLAVLAVAFYGVGILILVRIASARSMAPALGLGGLAASVGLALGRQGALQVAILLAVVALCIGVAAAAYVARLVGPKRMLAVAVAVAAVIVGAYWRPPAAMPSAPGAASQQHPNLVLVVIDTLRQDVFEAVVDETVEGRAFHRALGGAAWFSNAIAASPWTAPSIGSIMTGRYPAEHQLGAFLTEGGKMLSMTPLAESVPTLAEGLRRQGYWTEALVANASLAEDYGLARGFIKYQVCSGPYPMLPLLSSWVQLGLLHIPAHVDARSVRRLFERRLNALSGIKSPVFFVLHLMDPHVPLSRHRGLSPDPAVDEKLPEAERLYRDEVRFTLRELTLVLERLRSQDRWWNETAVVVVSDHGELFPSDGHLNRVTGEPLSYGHGHALYEELVRAPLVIRPPGGLPSERRIKALTSHVDLHDTLIDLLAVDIPQIGDDRVSLAPWLGPEPPTEAPQTRAHALIGMNIYGPRQRSLRTYTYKLIEYETGARELYALMSDPSEKNDVSETEVSLVQETSRQLEESESRLEAPPMAPVLELDAEAQERLRALGYIQ